MEGYVGPTYGTIVGLEIEQRLLVVWRLDASETLDGSYR